MRKRLTQKDLCCRYLPGKGGVVVRDARGRLRPELTKIYRAYARPSTDSYARLIVTPLHMWLMVAESMGYDFNSSPEDVRKVTNAWLHDHYGADVTNPEGPIVTVHAVDNANTVRGALTGLRVGLQMLADMGVRIAKNSFKAYRNARGNLSRHNKVARFGGIIPGEALLGGIVIKGTRPIPPQVAEGSLVPDTVREGFRQAKAKPREVAYLEALATSEARNSEVGSATFAGLAGVFGPTLMVRNKGHGHVASKKVTWSARARELYRVYFEGDRLLHDRLTPEFRTWAGRRPLTIELYQTFLVATEKDLSAVPLFLTVDGNAYESATFSHEIWRRAMVYSSIKYSPHHLRHAFVNQELQAIWEEYGTQAHLYVKELRDFVTRMGWSSWRSIAHYDFRELATTALARFFGHSHKGKGLRIVDHGDLSHRIMETTYHAEINGRASEPKPKKRS